MRIKSADLKNFFFSRVFAVFHASLMQEMPQTAICFLECLGRFKCHVATGCVFVVFLCVTFLVFFLVTKQGVWLGMNLKSSLNLLHF